MNRVTNIRTRAEFESFLPRWQEFLRTRAGAWNVYQEPAMVSLALEQDPDAVPLVVVIESDAGIECIAPCGIRRRSVPLRLGLVQLGESRAQVLKVFGDSFIHARDSDRVGDAGVALEALAAPALEWDFMLLENLAVPGPLWDCFATDGGRCETLRLDVVPGRIQPVQRLYLGASFAEYLGRMTSDTRYNLLRRRKKLAETSQGALELARLSQPGQVKEFLVQARQIGSQSWQAATLGKQDVGGGEIQLARLAEAGWLRSYVLRCAGAPVAYVLGHQHRGVFYHEETAYDRAWARWGPGTVLNLMLIEDLFAENKPNALDFGFGDNEYKRIFGHPAGEACVAFVSDPRRPRGRALVRRQIILGRVEQAARAALRILRLDRLARRLVKRKKG